MRNRSLIGGTVIGAAVVAAAVSYIVFSNGPTEAANVVVQATTSSTQPAGPQNPIYIEPGEVAVGPAVIVVSDVSVANRQLSISYDLHQLPPVEGLPPSAAFIPFQGFVEINPATEEIIYPTSWTAIVDGTEVPGSVANPEARAARFDIPDGVTASRVESAWINAYLIRIPLNMPFSLSTAEPVVEVVPGVTATLVQISEQSDSTIVRVEVSVSDPINLSGLDIAGAGLGVVSAVREAEGGPRWNVTFEGGEREAWDLAVVGSVWLEVQGRIDVPVGRSNG